MARKPKKKEDTGSPSDFSGREHIRNEIPIRRLMREREHLRQLLILGREHVMDPDTLEVVSLPIPDHRMKQIIAAINATDKDIDRVLPSLRPVNTPVNMNLSDEDMEPQNIRAAITRAALSGQLPIDYAKTVADTAGPHSGLDHDENELPPAITINMVDGRRTKDDGTPDDGDLDLGDALTGEVQD